MPSFSLDHASLLESALASEHGIVVDTDSVERLRAALYPIRARHEEYACLSFCPSPVNPDQLWIVKNAKKG